jgi:hypothetical protein
MVIENLTPEQKALFPVYVEKWKKIGLTTGPVDFENAKKSVCLAYEKVGLPHPTKFFVAKSPIDAIRLIKEIDPSMDARAIFNNMIYGNSDSYWLSYYQFIRNELKVECIHKLDGLVELANHCGWLSVYDDCVVFQDRPEFIKFDDQDRLHSENGPSIRYCDGFSVYSWHGVRIPKEWIENKNSALTPQIALKWENMEQRRAACEILGWDRIIRELNATVVDSDYDPHIGTLVDVEIPDVGKERFLKVLCGTGREFAIPVPLDINTALEANAWTFDIDPNLLRELEVRT